MADTKVKQIYTWSRLDDIENIETYRPGGFHPVKLHDMLDDRYKIVHKLGYGGFATIWLARDIPEKIYVAVKILMAEAPEKDLDMLRYLQAHAEGHPSLLSLQRAFTVKGPNGTHQCMVFGSIGPSLKKLADGGIQLSGPVARRAARQIAEGVAHLHDMGICHGDLASSNVLFEMINFDAWSEAEVYQHPGEPVTANLTLRGGRWPGPQAPAEVVEAMQYSNIDEEYLTGNIRIIDFGECFFVHDPPAKMLGTPAAYFAPEMLFGHPASTASDIWALRCLLFELQASKPLVCILFGVHEEALSCVVQTLGPLPRAWQDSYYDKNDSVASRPGEPHAWFDSSKASLRRPIESQVREIEPQLTSKEIEDFLDLLRGALEYEPSLRPSAKRLATDPWFTGQGRGPD